MKRLSARSRLAFAALTLVATTAGGAAPGATDANSDPGALPPPSLFFRHADILQAKLSPSGRWLAMTTANRTSRVFLAIVDIGEGKVPPKVIAAYSELDVRSFDWVNEERLVFNTIDREEGLNRQTFGPGLLSINRDGSNIRLLIRSQQTPAVSERTVTLTQPLEINHALLETLDDGSDDVIIGDFRFSGAGDLEAVTPKRLNVLTGRTSSIALGAPSHAMEWLFDRQGKPRVAETSHDGRVAVHFRPVDSEPWKEIASFATLERTMSPAALGADGKLYVLTEGKDRTGVLKTFDVERGKLSSETLIATPGFDLYASEVRDQDGRIVGFRYATDAAGTVWLDPSLKKLQAMVDDRFPGRINQLTCRRCTTDGVLMVFSYSDQDPGTYWLYRATPKTWESIGKVRSDVEPKTMAQMDFVRTKARDGEDLPLWITMPRGDSASPRPAVVLVHGGPWVRGEIWHWNAEAQFLASRGYVVIEPEFRGSTGYGLAHMKKGFKQWGGTMQDDLADAVKYMETQGKIDPKRVCIAGASYGGYATLMGMIRYPDVFRCGVAWVAVTDPRLLFENNWMSDMPREAREFTLPQMVGDPVKDAALLKDAAPVERAKEIKGPLLMAFGGDDVRVPLEHGRKMRSALRSAGKEPEYVVYDGEGHGFLKIENQLDFWNRVDRFLAKELR